MDGRDKPDHDNEIDLINAGSALGVGGPAIPFDDTELQHRQTNTILLADHNELVDRLLDDSAGMLSANPAECLLLLEPGMVSPSGLVSGASA